MNTLQSTRRFHFLGLFALMVSLALGSFWLVEAMRRNTDDLIPNGERIDPDLYVEKFNYVKIGETGEALYHVSGDRLTHNPKDDTYDVAHPVVFNLKNNETPTTVRSDRAKVNNDGSKIHMYDDVQMHRPASKKSEELDVKSSYMLVLPDDEIAQTDKEVNIMLGKSILIGTGMVSNNATRELTLMSKVHGTYQAPVR